MAWVIASSIRGLTLIILGNHIHPWPGVLLQPDSNKSARDCHLHEKGPRLQ